MKNTQNITIAMLSITAAVLLAILLVNLSSDQAQAGGVSIKQGDYIIGTGSGSTGNDLIYVIDIAAKKLVVYGLDINRGLLEAIDGVDLVKAFAEP
jgi:hypothetical protein